MNCGQCDRVLDRVHHVKENGDVTCKGFYCPPCKEFYPAILREKKLPITYDK